MKAKMSVTQGMSSKQPGPPSSEQLLGSFTLSPSALLALSALLVTMNLVSWVSAYQIEGAEADAVS